MGQCKILSMAFQTMTRTSGVGLVIVGAHNYWEERTKKILGVVPAIMLSSNIVFSRRPYVCVKLQDQLGELKLLTQIMRKNMLLSGKIYTTVKKVYTSSGSTGQGSLFFVISVYQY